MCHSTTSEETSRIGMKTWLRAGCLLVVACSVAVAGDRSQKSRTTVSREFYEGRQLFMKTWTPGEPSPIGGDGLGPLYNEQSCVACHHLGGVGGAGGNDLNVRMVTAVASPGNAKRGGEMFQGDLGDLHELFRTSVSIVLHRHATSRTFQALLRDVASYSQVDRRGEILDLKTSERNTPAIFGAGLIDAIPDRVLIEAGERKFRRFPEIKGRVSRLPSGRIGRFGGRVRRRPFGTSSWPHAPTSWVWKFPATTRRPSRPPSRTAAPSRNSTWMPNSAID